MVRSARDIAPCYVADHGREEAVEADDGESEVSAGGTVKNQHGNVGWCSRRPPETRNDTEVSDRWSLAQHRDPHVTGAVPDTARTSRKSTTESEPASSVYDIVD